MTDTISVFTPNAGRIRDYADRPLKALALNVPVDLTLAKVADVEADEATTGTRPALSGVGWTTATVPPGLISDDFAIPEVADTVHAVVVYDAGTGDRGGDLVVAFEFSPVLVSGDLPVVIPGGQLATLDGQLIDFDAQIADHETRISTLETDGGPVSSDDVTVPEDTYHAGQAEADLSTVLAEIGGDILAIGPGGSGATVVSLFSTDVDMVGGSWTDLPALDGGAGTSIPRAYLEGAVVCVSEYGDNFGLWVVTASGPCTPGDDLEMGTVLVSSAGIGLVGVPSNPGYGPPEMVAVVATQAAAAAAAAATQAAAAAAAAAATQAATLDLLRGQAAITTPPSQWLECGNGAPGGSDGYWYCTTTQPSPTDSIQFRGWLRVRMALPNDFLEWHSEAADLTVHGGSGGSLDRFEVAVATPVPTTTPKSFLELLRAGESAETSYADTGVGVYSSGDGGVVPHGVWCWLRIDVDLTTATIYWRCRTDVGWDFTDPDDDTTWLTTRTYVIPGATPFVLADSTSIEQWIGRNGGLFDVARVQRWDDDVLVLDMDASTGTLGAVTIDDSVMESSPGIPATWDTDGTNRIAS